MGRHHPDPKAPHKAAQGPTPHAKVEWPTIDEDAPAQGSRWFEKPLDKRPKKR